MLTDAQRALLLDDDDCRRRWDHDRDRDHLIREIRDRDRVLRDLLVLGIVGGGVYALTR